jgi:hypothetical protein
LNALKFNSTRCFPARFARIATTDNVKAINSMALVWVAPPGQLLNFPLGRQKPSNTIYLKKAKPSVFNHLPRSCLSCADNQKAFFKSLELLQSLRSLSWVFTPRGICFNNNSKGEK